MECDYPQTTQKRHDMRQKLEEVTFQHLKSTTINHNHNTHPLSCNFNSDPKNTQEGDACI